MLIVIQHYRLHAQELHDDGLVLHSALKAYIHSRYFMYWNGADEVIEACVLWHLRCPHTFIEPPKRFFTIPFDLSLMLEEGIRYIDHYCFRPFSHVNLRLSSSNFLIVVRNGNPSFGVASSWARRYFDPENTMRLAPSTVNCSVRQNSVFSWGLSESPTLYLWTITSLPISLFISIF